MSGSSGDHGGSGDSGRHGGSLVSGGHGGTGVSGGHGMSGSSGDHGGSGDSGPLREPLRLEPYYPPPKKNFLGESRGSIGHLRVLWRCGHLGGTLEAWTLGELACRGAGTRLG